MNIYRCLAVDCSEYLRDSRVSIAKRQVNASNIYAASPPAVCAASMGRKTKRFFCGMGKCGARCLLTKRYGKREIKTE